MENKLKGDTGRVHVYISFDHFSSVWLWKKQYYLCKSHLYTVLEQTSTVQWW